MWKSGVKRFIKNICEDRIRKSRGPLPQREPLFAIFLFYMIISWSDQIARLVMGAYPASSI